MRFKVNDRVVLEYDAYFSGNGAIGTIFEITDDIDYPIGVRWTGNNGVRGTSHERANYLRPYQPKIVCESTPCYDSDCECVYDNV